MPTESTATEGGGWLASVLRLPNDSRQKTLIVASTLCLVCSVLVSGAAVGLRPKQEVNKTLDRKRNILLVAGLIEPGADGEVVESRFAGVEARLVDLETGEYVEGVDATTYDQKKASKDPERSEGLSPEVDKAGIKRRADRAPVYLVKEGERITKVVLPVHGYGLWSTMYGFLAIDAKAESVEGITFYEHAETPGLGGEIDNKGWQAQFVGKEIFDDGGDVALAVAKGAAPAGSEHKVDGLSGATLTANGVTYMLQFWLGENGFGAYLEKLKERV